MSSEGQVASANGMSSNAARVGPSTYRICGPSLLLKKDIPSLQHEAGHAYCRSRWPGHLQHQGRHSRAVRRGCQASAEVMGHCFGCHESGGDRPFRLDVSVACMLLFLVLSHSPLIAAWELTKIGGPILDPQ